MSLKRFVEITYKDGSKSGFDDLAKITFFTKEGAISINCQQFLSSNRGIILSYAGKEKELYVRCISHSVLEVIPFSELKEISDRDRLIELLAKLLPEAI